MLTGNVRYRKTWLGKLVLQVEETIRHTRDLNGSGYYDTWDVTKYRDARASDFVFPKVDISFTPDKLRKD